MYELTSVYQEDYSTDILINLFTKYNLTYFMILHDKDLKENGETKKPHYHILLQPYSNNPKRDILKLVNDLMTLKETNVSFKAVKKLKPFARYLLHLDNPEKYQYNLSDILTNDMEQYKELIKISKLMTETDLLLDKYIEYLNGLINAGVTVSTKDIYDFFKNEHKLDYWLKNNKGLYEMYLMEAI